MLLQRGTTVSEKYSSSKRKKMIALVRKNLAFYSVKVNGKESLFWTITVACADISVACSPNTLIFPIY